MAIPKVIHYCWFGGGEMPELNQRCLDSWRQILPEYEVMRWDESNFDVNTIDYTRQAYEHKKYAFVSDVARFYVLYHHGGIYLDTDVEVLKPLDEFLDNDAFMGFESTKTVAPGLIIGAEKKHETIGHLYNAYIDRQFENDGILNLTTVVQYTTEHLKKNGLKQNGRLQIVEGIHIYPRTYFCPTSHNSKKTYFSEHTKTIHHYSASWLSEAEKERNSKLSWRIIVFFYMPVQKLVKGILGKGGFQKVKAWIMHRFG